MSSLPAGVIGSSPALKSERMFRKYFEFGDSPNPYRPGPRGSASTCQIPERSGLPFTRETGPAGFTLPSGVRGAPEVGFCHWACAHKPAPTKAIPIQMCPRILLIKPRCRLPLNGIPQNPVEYEFNPVNLRRLRLPT